MVGDREKLGREKKIGEERREERGGKWRKEKGEKGRWGISGDTEKNEGGETLGRGREKSGVERRELGEERDRGKGRGESKVERRKMGERERGKWGGKRGAKREKARESAL